MAKKKPLFTIDKDSIITADGSGHQYCTTTPDHPYGERRPDRDKRYVYLHRALVELRIGRYLKSYEEVNHKNGIHSDNRPSNLELTTKPEHARGHSKEKKFWKKSPENKPQKSRKKTALTVARMFLNEIAGM